MIFLFITKRSEQTDEREYWLDTDGCVISYILPFSNDSISFNSSSLLLFLPPQWPILKTKGKAMQRILAKTCGNQSERKLVLALNNSSSLVWKAVKEGELKKRLTEHDSALCFILTSCLFLAAAETLVSIFACTLRCRWHFNYGKSHN